MHIFTQNHHIFTLPIYLRLHTISQHLRARTSYMDDNCNLKLYSLWHIHKLCQITSQKLNPHHNTRQQTAQTTPIHQWINSLGKLNISHSYCTNTKIMPTAFIQFLYRSVIISWVFFSSRKLNEFYINIHMQISPHASWFHTWTEKKKKIKNKTKPRQHYYEKEKNPANIWNLHTWFINISMQQENFIK